MDAPGGACSFTARAHQLGYCSTATDIAYFYPAEQLYLKGKEDIQHVVNGLRKVEGEYNWDYFHSIQDLERHRISALNDCVEHMIASPHSYIPSVLPELPFADDQFDMVLCAHFLFMYADRLDPDFHRHTIQEMIRVSKKEVRIFPLTDLTGKRYEHMQSMLKHVSELGWETEERKVDYEFQKNANSMLRIYSGNL